MVSWNWRAGMLISWFVLTGASPAGGSPRVGGRIHLDAGIAWSPDLSPYLFRYELRRVRVSLSGTLWEEKGNGKKGKYKMQLEFAGGGKVRFRSVYLGFPVYPGWSIRVGQMKEPLGMERLASSNDILLMERGYPEELFRARNLGVLLIGKPGNWRVQLGTFLQASREDQFVFARTPSFTGWSITGRVAHRWTASAQASPGYLVLALSGSYRVPPDNILKLSAGPEARGFPSRISESFWQVQSYTLLGAEVLASHNGWTWLMEGFYGSIQGAYLEDTFQRHTIPLYTGYLTVAYRPGRVRRTLKSSFWIPGPVETSRTLEIAVRMNALWIRGTGSHPSAGILSFTLGGTWHLSPRTRILINYVFTPGQARRYPVSHALTARWQVAF